MLARQHMDVVAFGPSPHDDASYYLIRALAACRIDNGRKMPSMAAKSGRRARARRS